MEWPNVDGLRLPPSKAHIWGAPDGCTGYPRMAAFEPEAGDSDAVREGIATHELAANMVRDGLAYATHRADVVGQTAGNGVVWTDEMYEGADMCAQYVLGIMRETGVTGGDGFRVEQKVICHEISPVTVGYIDYRIYDQNTDTLHLFDFKYGRTVVEAFENWQMICYYSGSRVNDVDDAYRNIVVHIIQPRSYHEDGPIRTWRIKGGEIRAHINILKTQAAVALSDQATARTGDHCRYCRARHACPAAQKAAMTGIEYSTRPDPVNLNPVQIGLELHALQRATAAMNARRTGLESVAESMLRNGEEVPGFRMHSPLGDRAWVVPEGVDKTEYVVELGKTLDVDLRATKLVTPAGAERLGMDKGLVAAFTHKPAGKSKLTADDGTRSRQVLGDQPITGDK